MFFSVIQEHFGKEIREMRSFARKMGETVSVRRHRHDLFSPVLPESLYGYVLLAIIVNLTSTYVVTKRGSSTAPS